MPHVLQKPDFCGEAVVAAYLQYLGRPYDQDDVFGLSGMDPARGMGATTRELAVALERIGFRPGSVWASVDAAREPPELAAHFSALLDDLARGIGSIVCMRYDSQPRTSEHFRLVLGYDAETDEVIFHEPAVARGAYRRMPRSQFLELWPLRYHPERSTVIRLRLEAGPLHDPPARPRHSAADFAQHVRTLREHLPDGFTLVVEPPFVVLGDEEPARVRARAEQTVRWAADKLKEAYFAEDPRRILDVWLFRDDESYRRNARALFGDEPSTPYGYYADEHGALVMNIATGGGTLVHEIVHPFMETNFPDCPAWFNEALGSLYEQSSSRDSHIVGLPNWRLPSLQQAIRAKRLPSFASLTATTSSQFYDADPGTNYAQARYLAYYLQERGLLGRFYREFRASVRRDPTGYATLRAVLGEPDMGEFQRHWEHFVLGLRFP